MWNYIQNNLTDLLLIVVGLSAVAVYIWQKKDQRCAAATLVKEQIDTIERNVFILKNDANLGNISVYRSKSILIENHWEHQKHLLVKKLSHSEIETIQRFFDNATQIENARLDIIKVINNDWMSKSQAGCHIVAGIVLNNGEDSQIEEIFTQFMQKYSAVSPEFVPDIIINALIKNLQNFEFISGSTAYAKMEKLSYEK